MRLSIITILAICLSCSFANAANDLLAVDNITVSQKISANNNLFTSSDEVTVSYSLAVRTPIKISVYGAQPLGIGRSWYAHPSNLAAAFTPPDVQAGKQQFTFKLADVKAPDVSQIFANGMPQPLAGKLPGDYIIEIRSGNKFSYLATHLFATGEILSPNRVIDGFYLGAIRDSKGNILIADRGAWRGRRFTPNWKLEETFPNASLGQSSDPVECFDVAVDSKDSIYLTTVNGLYKFSAAGTPAAYGADEDYLKYPYPAETRNVLGVRLQKEPGMKRYVFGPGGGGAGSKEYNSQEAVKNPGFSYQWGGAAIDKKDNIYLIRMDPTPEIQVFDPTGKYLRSLPLPENQQPGSMRFGIDGALWLACGGNLLRLNPQTGKEEKNIDRVWSRTLHIAPDGTIFLYNEKQVWRFNPAGEVVPFTAAGSTVREDGRYLNLNPQENNVPAGTAGFASGINSLVAYADGSFEVLANPQNNKRAVLRYAADGTFLPLTPTVTIMPQETGNIFLNNDPANLAIQCCNLSETAQQIAISTNIKDLAEKSVTSQDDLRTIAPLAIVTALLPLDSKPNEDATIPASRKFFGYYIIDASVNSGKISLANERLFGGRVVDRDNIFHPYSPFGSVRMDGNPELLRRIGGGLNRGHNAVYWNEVEPKPGEWQLYPADTLSFMRQRALPAMTILGYGEPWDNGGFARCRITSYDTFWQYCSRVIQQYKATPMMWQFWNEPNYFWHVPGPYRYEHYAMVLQAVYSIAKAIDPDTPLICDGFAAEAQGMRQLGEYGAGGYTDGVPIHYPGAKTIAFDNMPIVGAVESKAEMIKELAAIRDKYYPGREMLNTEEGLWGLANRTPLDGAELLPRIYVTQLAAGLDRLTWFECFSKDDPTYLLRGVQEGPWPAYFAYATASRLLEDAQYVGALSDDLTRVYLFARHGKPLLVAWSMQGTREYTLPVKLNSYAITDWQGNTTSIVEKKSIGPHDVTLQLGQSVIYLSNLPDSILQQFVDKFITEQAANGEMASARKMLMEGKEKLPLNFLQHATRCEEVACMQDRPAFNYDKAVKSANAQLDAVTKALKEKEGDDGYLRDTRIALEIARRTAYYMNYSAANDGLAYAGRLAELLSKVLDQVSLHLKSETLWYPGVMLRVALDTSALREKTPAKEPLDEKFDPQVNKKAGESVELEITLYNWQQKPITGTFSPVLPENWQAEQSTFQYNIAPGEFMRVITVVKIPADAKAGTYMLGATTKYQGVTQRELHTHRVVVK